MNADLEATLGELGPEYRALVARLQSAPELEVRPRVRRSFRRRAAAAAAALIAASLAVAFFRHRPAPPAVRDAPAEYVLAVERSPAAVREILRTQLPDGSWGKDWLTRQNAAALAAVDASSSACRRAVRYLRSRGLSPLSSGELAALGCRL